MKKKIVRSIIIAVALVAVVALWMGLYPDKDDPKNIQYVFWKWHLANINLDRAVSVMHHDPGSERMILGKSEKELTKRFGYLLTPEAAPRCFKLASRGAVTSGDKALFLRKSDYLIFFRDGVAVRVVELDEAEPC